MIYHFLSPHSTNPSPGSMEYKLKYLLCVCTCVCVCVSVYVCVCGCDEMRVSVGLCKHSGLLQDGAPYIIYFCYNARQSHPSFRFKKEEDFSKLEFHC